jgi:hypothetical protein
MDMHNSRKVKKDKLTVMIITADYKVTGDVHVFPNGRLTDYINNGGDTFIALTAAEIIPCAQNSDTIKIDYVALNKSDIIMIYPLNN